MSARPAPLTAPAETPIPATIEQQKLWEEYHARQELKAATIAPANANDVTNDVTANDVTANAAATIAVTGQEKEEKVGKEKEVGEEVGGGSVSATKASALFYDPFAARRARALLQASAKPKVRVLVHECSLIPFCDCCG